MLESVARDGADDDVADQAVEVEHRGRGGRHAIGAELGARGDPDVDADGLAAQRQSDVGVDELKPALPQFDIGLVTSAAIAARTNGDIGRSSMSARISRIQQWRGMGALLSAGRPANPRSSSRARP